MLFRVFALAAWLGSQVAALTPPSKDPWYDQPANISAYGPGDLIRSRSVENALHPYGPVGKISVESVVQYLYRTTDSKGKPVAAATTLIVPHNADPEKLLVYETFYDANNPDCSPSYSLRPGSSFETKDQFLPSVNQPLDLAFVSQFSPMVSYLIMTKTKLMLLTIQLAASLQQGWWIMTPDYEGLDARFAVGLLSGHATLDSTRVALREGPKVGLSKTARYAMWGYSGGALAVEWAAELQPSYAPELKFEGAAFGGLLPNLTSAIETINMGPFSGAAFVIVIGISKAYPEFREWLMDSLIGDKRSQFFAAANSCIFGEVLTGAIHDIFSFFSQGRTAFLDDVPRSTLDTVGQMGTVGKPTMPMYVYKGVLDEISPVTDTDQLVDSYCNNGEPSSIEYHRILAAEHVSAAVLGSADALDWLTDRLDGKPLNNPDSCHRRTTLAMDIKPKAIKYFGTEAYATLVSLFGGTLSPF